MHNFFRGKDGSGMPPIVVERTRCDQYDRLWYEAATDARPAAISSKVLPSRPVPKLNGSDRMNFPKRAPRLAHLVRMLRVKLRQLREKPMNKLAKAAVLETTQRKTFSRIERMHLRRSMMESKE